MPEHHLNPDTWVDHYADYLYNYAISRVNDMELAKDLVQETFFAGLRSAENFKGQASERTWLVAILKRKVIDHYRRKKTRKGSAEVRMEFRGDSDEQGDWLESMVADGEALSGSDLMENKELGLALSDCIEALPPKQGKVFRMKTLEGMGTEEICNSLSINPSNLWVMVHRARQSLMLCLNEKWFEL